MTITGTTKRIDRVTVDAPEDGVHVLGKDGKIKGTHSLYVDGKLTPYGMVGFYWRTGDTGWKVYYSMKHRATTRKEAVRRSYRKMQRMYEAGLCPKPHKMKWVSLVLDGHKHGAWAIKMDHVHYPEAAWEKFAQGYPYDWDAVDRTEHPEHGPEGYTRFVGRLGKSMKLGDVIYCTKQKRWFVVDVDEL